MGFLRRHKRTSSTVFHTSTDLEDAPTIYPSAAIISSCNTSTCSLHDDDIGSVYQYSIYSNSSTSIDMDSYRSRNVSLCEPNTGIFGGIFSTNSSISSTSSGSSSIYNQQRSKSIAPQPITRRMSSFFGLGANSNHSNSSSLAFGSNSRSCSGSTTLSKMPATLHEIPLAPVKVDEFYGLDFQSLLQQPDTLEECTQASFKQLHDVSLQLVNKLYKGYLSRTKELNEMVNKVESLKDDLADKDTRIQSLKFQVQGLAHEQQDLLQAVEKAEIAAEKAKEEAKATVAAERNRLAYSLVNRSNYDVDEGLDHTRLASSQKFRKPSYAAPRFSFHSAKYSNSDSGFESGSDAGSLFSPDYSPFGSKRTSYALPPINSNFDTFLSPNGQCSPPTSPTKVNASRGDSISTVIAASDRSLSLNAVVAGDMKDKCDCSTGRSGWDFVKDLRVENGDLKTRIGELEECLTSCLDVVGDL